MRVYQNVILMIIILISLALGSATLTRGHEWGDDFASYIMQAQSILNGNIDEFIKQNSFTISNSSFQIGPVAYPWGYPLILTPELAFKGVHPLILKLPGLVFFAGFLFCLYHLTKDRLTPTESLFLVSLFAFNPTLVKFLDQILSDIPFLFFSFFTLVLVVNFESRQSAWKCIALGVIIFFTFFIRTTGIILLASFLAYQSIRFYSKKEERKNIFQNTTLSVLTFGLLWLITSLIFPNGQGSYFAQLKGLTPDRFQQNITDYFYSFGTFFGSNPVWLYVYYVLVVFFIIGTWVRFREDQLLIIFFVLYFLAMLFWPEWQGVRFIFPLLPIFIYFAFQGISAFITKLPEEYHPFSQGLSYIFWLVLIGTFLVNAGTAAYLNLKDKRQINGPFDAYSLGVYNYIKKETPPDSVVVFYKPRAMRLFTDRNTLLSTECNRLLLGDYVVISKKAENSQIPPNEIDDCGLALKNVFENRRFIIYQVPK